MKPIVILLRGGLGNQLFQLAAGIYVKDILGREVRFSDIYLRGSPLKYRFFGITPRRMMIGDLLLQNEYEEISIIKFVGLRLMRLMRKSFWTTEGDQTDTIGLLQRAGNCSRVLDGYFQDMTLTMQAKEQILARFCMSTEFRNVVPGKPRNVIAVHVRFGDYISNQSAKQMHGFTELSYFQNGISFLETGAKDVKIEIYSDDIFRARTFFGEFPMETQLRLEFQETKSEISDMARLSSAESLVICNSTFSWWAAWFASNLNNAKVVIPVPWLSSPSNLDARLTSINWHVLKREIAR